jgi:hypothetical protein
MIFVEEGRGQDDEEEAYGENLVFVSRCDYGDVTTRDDKVSGDEACNAGRRTKERAMMVLRPAMARDGTGRVQYCVSQDVSLPCNMRNMCFGDWCGCVGGAGGREICALELRLRSAVRLGCGFHSPDRAKPKEELKLRGPAACHNQTPSPRHKRSFPRIQLASSLQTHRNTSLLKSPNSLTCKMFRNNYDNDSVTLYVHLSELPRRSANDSSSPQGRIFQVEYAQEAVKQGSVVVGVVSKTHAVLAAIKVRPLHAHFVAKLIIRSETPRNSRPTKRKSYQLTATMVSHSPVSPQTPVSYRIS